MEINGLTIKNQSGTNTYYEGVVLTVQDYSQYNDNQVKFREISEYWLLPNKFQAFTDRDGTVDDQRPPIGTVATFFLKTNPKKNDPSKFYYDIVSIEKADGEPIATQQQPQGDPRDEWQQPESGKALAQINQDKWDLKDIRIAKAQAWNGLTAIVTGLIQSDIPPWLFGGADDGRFEQMVDDWWTGYELLKAGKTPFTEDEPAEEDPVAAELDEQAQQHLADVANEEPPAEDSVEILPW